MVNIVLIIMRAQRAATGNSSFQDPTNHLSIRSKPSGDCGSLWQAAVEMALSGPRKVDEAITNVWQVDKGGTLVLVSAIAPFLFLVLTRRDLGFDD